MRQYIENVSSNKTSLAVWGVLSFFLLQEWDIKYSVYITPFNTVKLSSDMCTALIFRLVTGFVVSGFFILLFKRIQSYVIIEKLAVCGRYTLVMYTASFILNGVMRRILNMLDFSVVQPVMLEVASLFWSVSVCIVSVLIAQVMSKNEIMNKVFLGVYK